MTDQDNDITKGQLLEPINIIGLSCRNMCEGLITGAEVIPRQIYNPKPFPAQMTACKNWRTGANCIACKQFNRLGSVLAW